MKSAYSRYLSLPPIEKNMRIAWSVSFITVLFLQVQLTNSVGSGIALKGYVPRVYRMQNKKEVRRKKSAGTGDMYVHV